MASSRILDRPVIRRDPPEPDIRLRTMPVALRYKLWDMSERRAPVSLAKSAHDGEPDSDKRTAEHLDGGRVQRLDSEDS